MFEKYKHVENIKLIVAVLVFLGLLIGSTLAFYKTVDHVDNNFITGKFKSEVAGDFTSPSGWTPGDETPKTLTVKNTGNICENVRVSYTEKWLDKNGNELPNTNGIESFAIINLDNAIDWVKSGDYYYYNKNLNSAQTTTSLIKSITYNKDAFDDYKCNESGNISKCTTSTGSYEGATYQVFFNVETIECDSAADTWGVDPTSLHIFAATFDKGKVVNAKLKTLASGSSKTYEDSDAVITSFVSANALPAYFAANEGNTISSSSSAAPIYAWFDSGTIYYYTIADEISLNVNPEYMLSKMTALTDVEGLRGVSTSATTTLSSFFEGSSSLSDISSLSTWNVSNVTNLDRTFRETSLTSSYLYSLQNWNVGNVSSFTMSFFECNLTDLIALASWDTSSATNFICMFQNNTNLSNIDAVANFQTDKVTEIQWMFQACSLVDLDPLADWDTSSLRDISGMFHGNRTLTDISALENWEVDTVTDMHNFLCKTGISSPIAISNWNVSNVTDISYLFNDCANLVSLNDLSSWNTSKVTNMRGMCLNSSNITDVYYINNWQIANVTDFYGMFNGCPTHPTFANRAGTWNNGTFVPTGP